MADASSIGSLSSSIDSLVAQYKSSLQSKSVTPLTDKKTTLNARITSLSTMKAKLQALYETAGGLAVSRSESVDVLNSSRFTNASTTIATSELTAAEKLAGSATRQIKIMMGGTDVTVDVTIAKDDTNDTVLTSIANAINASGTANQLLTASVSQLADGKEKLVLTSKTTGSQHAITLIDVGAGTLLDSIGLSDSVVTNRTGASAAATADDPVGNPGGYSLPGSIALLNAARSTKFVAYATQSSDIAVTASADSGATTGTHTLSVSQLAKNDTLITRQFVSTGTTISDALAGEGYGTKKFTITTGTGSAVEVSVAVTQGQTNATVLSAIASAVSAKTDFGVTASVVNDDGTHSRLVLTSKATGSAAAVSAVADVSGTLATTLGLTGISYASGARTLSSTSQTGFLKADSGLLDAKLKIDGVDIVRGTNTVTDALQGVTLTLNSLTTSDMTLGVTVNSGQIRSNLQKFLSDYNTAISHIKSQTAVDPTNNVRQIFAGDATILSLRFNLQTDVTKAVTGLGADPAALSDFGITADKDGALSVSDAVKFNNATTTDISKLAQVFDSADGIATRIKNRLSGFVATAGRLDATKDGVSGQLTSLNKQITKANERITMLVTKYRDQFAQLQAAYTAATNQQSMMTQLYTSLGLI
ncbi:MAG: flagellar filament capping protein FliD [Ignavibacteriales bacterium]|nr:flagellar filament capping protein FliD [Ignavibacteriales bacterium]